MQVNVKYTYADLLTAPDDRNRYELSEGELIMTPSPTPVHQLTSMNLAYKFKNFVDKHNLGVVLTAPIDIYFDEENVVQPDILFVSNERRSIIEEKRIIGAPDLIVEITSPSTKDRDYGFKFRKYAEVGVKEYWIADPDKKVIEVYQLSEKGFELYKSFSGNDKFESIMFPGLNFPASEIWKI